MSVRSELLTIGKRSGYFLFLFILVKASAFFAPLLASNAAIDLGVYGVFEFSLTFGILASVIIDIGGNGAYPFYRLKKQESSISLGAFYFHYLPITAIIFALLAADFAFDFISIKYELALLAALILGMQTRLSTIAKSNNQVFLSVLADGGLFIVVNLYNSYLWSSNGFFDNTEIYYVFVVYSLLLSSIFGYQFYHRAGLFNLKRYYDVLKWGSRIVVSTFLVIGLTGGARMLIDALVSTSEVGRYGFYFRLASVMLLVHQAVNIFFFKKIYTVTAAVFNKYVSVFLAGVFLSCLIVWWVLPWALTPFFRVLDTYSTDDQLLFLVVSCHVFFWISMAVYENLIYREDLAGKMNKYLLLILLLFIGFSFFAFRWSNISTELISFANVCCLFLCTETQYQCLKMKNINLKRIRQVNVIAFLVFMFIIMMYWL